MKPIAPVLLALVGLLVAAPLVAAQNPDPNAILGIALSATDPAKPIPYAGSIDVPVTVSVGCGMVLRAIGENHGATVTVGLQNAPSWLNVTTATWDLLPPSTDASGCATNQDGVATKDLSIKLAVSPDAPGVVEQTLNVSATITGEAPAILALHVSVEYHALYDVTPDVTFPLKVTGHTVGFNLTVVQRSNARSMVMMEDKSETAGSLSGLTSTVYEDGARTKVFPIVFQAPTTPWTTSMVTFKTYSHWLLPQGAGNFSAEKDLSWQFTNAAPAGSSGSTSSAPAKKSPEPVFALLGLALLGLAAVARRR